MISKRAWRWSLAAAMAASLGGCASMSESECQRADWYQQGMQDGRDGQARDRIDDHAKACGKIGIQPDETRWQEGWIDGLRRYCRPANGWQLGLRGTFYRGVCRDQPEGDDFERAYDTGRRIHALGEQLERNASEIDRLERKLRDATTDDERKHLRAQLRDLDSEQMRLRQRQRMEMLSAPRP
ncbi:DUF2799 domain-containing protein [Pelomonas sp. BJYL3]|uniref:DUF2799 domain-containing protein n=1 Tax=Pelomonas sp. BJYL3 TaxID=2976697 RepID=UPI0022B55D82|nr:DUF2799 domain-containing protein [Pelomonas sp. BJYL3]